LIIIFVLVIYFITLNLLSKVHVVSQSNVNLDNYLTSYNIYGTKNIISFIDSNKHAINKWADSDLVISKGDLIEKEIPEDKKKLYDDVFNSYVNFMGNLDFKEPYFYIRTEEKEMQIKKVPGADLEFDTFGINNPTNDLFFHGLEPNKLEGDKSFIHRIYFNTENGRLVMVIFYDESKIYDE